MSADLDLVPFGFTPTESTLYQVLLTDGPGTGYTVARSAGLARANVYAALEGLVSKGAARVETGRPRQYRPEPPSTLLARLADRQGEALEALSRALDSLAAPETPTLVELTSARGALQLMAGEIARAESRIALIAPVDGCMALGPHLRRAATNGLELVVGSTGPVSLGAIAVRQVTADNWPGEPVLLVVDRRSALIGSREQGAFNGHFASSVAFVAAAQRTVESFFGGSD